MANPSEPGGPAARPLKASLPYRHTVAGCLDGAIGPYGLAAATLDQWLEKLGPGLADLRQDYEHRRLPLLRIPEETADLDAAEAALHALSRDARTLVFFGTGGSSLGGQALAQVAGWNIPGVADERQFRLPRTRFYDNLDPDTLARSLEHLDLASTRFIVTSKSGNTPETLVQALAAMSALEARGLAGDMPRLVLGITEAAAPGRKNGLRSLLAARGVPILEHHAGVGGRFSVLTNVGLIVALARGLDARAIRSGARRVIEALCAGSAAADFPPALGAAVAVALAKERGVRVHVMMPYADRLGRFARWFVQLWAESLGKGGEGTSPIACLGPLDQHSQLQLFMDGPHEHLITVLRVATSGTGPRIEPGLAAAAGLNEMAGRTVGDLVAAQAHGIPDALRRAGRPVETLDVANLDEETVGALLMHFMVQTVLAGRLLGIDPFDQPAVELGKVLTRERLENRA